MRTVRDIPHLQSIPVLVRAALNVPVDKGGVANDYRLRRGIPTIQYLIERGARVVLISHIGEKGTETLAPVAEALKKFLPKVLFCPQTIGPVARQAIRDLSPGEVLVLENLRRDVREKENDPSFAAELASLADVFVQDSFDACHREHASMVGVPKLLPSYAGLLVEEEVQELSKALHPENPSIAVIGGAKFSTKEPVLATLLETYEKVFVGGALANDFLKARGYETGRSLVSGGDETHIQAMLRNQKLLLPLDVVVVPSDAMKSERPRDAARVAQVSDVHPDEVILDHGPDTSDLLAVQMEPMKSVLWNGPLGMYEEGFTDGTDALAQTIAHTTAHSVLGGGDTVASIERLRLLSKFSFVSTGGGAMLDFLAQGTLPGIAVL